MRTEVHVHGTVVLVEGVSIGQVEGALRPWLDYLDCASIKEARSLEQDEPGIVFDRKRFLLEICWTGDVGRNFQDVLGDVRRELALGHLARPDLSVTAITSMLGFTDTSNFTRAFKRWTGLSPTRYREAPAAGGLHGRAHDGRTLGALGGPPDRNRTCI